MLIQTDEVMVVNGRLTQIGFSFRDNRHYSRSAVFKCECGRRTVAQIKSVKGGSTRSCGCSTGEWISESNTTHGLRNSAEYNSWSSMKARCLSETSDRWKDYGGRGIQCCERWLSSFENFISDMGNRPEGTSLERKDNSKGYSPENCVWATRTEQNNNQRSNRIVEIDGEEKTISQWSRISGVPASTILWRLNHPERWPVRDAVFCVPDYRKKELR